MIGVALRRAASRTSRPGRVELRLRAGEGLAEDPIGQVALAVRHQLGGEPGGRPVGRDRLVLGHARDALATGHYFLPPGRRGLGAVLAATLLAVTDAGCVEGAADDVVLDRREVLDPAAADEHDRVLLEVVADARDVGRDLHLVAELHAGDLAEGRVRLLRRHRAHLETDAPLLRRARNRHLAPMHAVPALAHGGRLDLRDLRRAAVAHELADRRHEDAAPFGSVAGTECGSG